ncbi:hypothetical protein OPT61_g2083 [Boeremia exigua]|uniref:Uncharacterized protein n=1 Tax=Boeremia exigua TaxID=749465 RepID=A0ACC2IN01_9PLEO|nr:hypothetical protein OPT61_g2083 [Boeremia exigua]
MRKSNLCSEIRSRLTNEMNVSFAPLYRSIALLRNGELEMTATHVTTRHFGVYEVGGVVTALTTLVPSACNIDHVLLHGCIMASANTSDTEHGNAALPKWLTKHLNIEWSPSDVDALLESIDASQSSHLPTLPQLPAELLVLILKHVPVAYILDWRLVCRGFRDAIDGPILYHLLQRTQLIGYLGSKKSAVMERLQGGVYEELHLVTTNFDSFRCEGLQSNENLAKPHGPVWNQTRAVFKMDMRWHDRHRFWNDLEGNLPSANRMLSLLELHRSRQGFGALIWAIKLKTAVLDLDLPLDPERQSFDVSVDIDWSTTSVTVSVEWKPMIFRFLKTEAALRRLMEEKYASRVTFSHTEDCLRAVRRQRLHASLDLDDKIDRHIMWSLRLLRPLWGRAGHGDPSALDHVEIEAVGILLILRRTAALSQHQLDYLQQLAVDYNSMVRKLNAVSRSLRALKACLLLPGHDDVIYIDVPGEELEALQLPLNTVAWSDAQRLDVEHRLQQWRAQESLVTQMQALLVASRSEPIKSSEMMAFDL